MNNNKNLSESLFAILDAAGAKPQKSVTGSDTIFAYGFGIFATLTGNIQARDVRDKDCRFTIGTCNDSAQDLADTFLGAIADSSFLYS